MHTESESFNPVPHPSWLRSRWRYGVLALGAVLFFTPGAAWLVGVQTPKIENRPLVALPSLSRGLHVFSDLTQWSLDHLPLRNLAIRANARLSEDLFGEAATYTAPGDPVGIGQTATLAGGRAGSGAGSGVILGRNGWLFISDEFNQGCKPELSLAQVTDGIRRLDSILIASGRRVVIAIPPDKDTVDQRFVPSSVAVGDCARRAKEHRWAALGSLGLADYVDLLTPLRALDRAAGQPAFLPTDSHWTDRAAATVFARAVLDALSPRLYASAQVRPDGPTFYTGDLSVLAGDPKHATDTHWNVTRPGVTRGETTQTVPFTNFPVRHYMNYSRPGVPLVRGRTLIYGDSFTERSLDKLAPFFADATRVPDVNRGAVEGMRDAAVAQLVAHLRSADTVVIEQVERIMAGSAQGSILAPDVLNSIEQGLAAAPAGRGLVVR